MKRKNDGVIVGSCEMLEHIARRLENEGREGDASWVRSAHNTITLLRNGLTKRDACVESAEAERDEARRVAAAVVEEAAQAWNKGFAACEDATGLRVSFDVPNPYDKEGEG